MPICKELVYSSSMTLSKTDLLKNYKRSAHLKDLYSVLAEKHLLDESTVSYIFDLDWKRSEMEPEITTHLLDSYYNLGLRPDFAFTSLWAATNSLYFRYRIETLTAADRAQVDEDTNDSKCILYILTQTVTKSSAKTKKNLCDFIGIIPDKLLRFFSQQLLKSFAIYQYTRQYYDCAGFFKNKSFEKGFPQLYDVLKKTFIESFVKNNYFTTDPVTLEPIFHSHDPDKNRKIIDACVNKLKELLTVGKTEIESPDKLNKFTVTFDDEKKIRFVFRYIIYASRNHSVHGKTTSRLNSPNFNTEYYRTCLYLYFITYQYFSIFLNISGRASDSVISQAELNMQIRDKSKVLIFK